MALSQGTRLGPYEITAPVGAGGMGEVYRARDTRLERSVAVKILPADFAANAQFRLRFEREAKTISQLEHPNICRLYDVGDDYLVMELLDGETLAERIARGPLPLGDVLRYGIEIAEALDKAHQHGVVHRDLKPGNVMITASGAKLLDFGLARSNEIQVSADGATIQKAITQEGTIVGTFQYMAPEQLEGASVDHRCDLFALGAVLYEMATGRRAFQGSTKTSLIAAIVTSQPAPLSQVVPVAPATLEHVVQRCLAKDPVSRWQSARDVAEELKWIRAGDAPVAAPPRKGRERLAFGIAALAVIAAAALATWIMTRPAKRVVTSINAPDKTRFMFDSASAVLSPDGESLAVVAAAEDGRPALWVRPLSSPLARRLPGTEGVSFPFWSPDSRSIAFFSDGFLKRTDADGGPVERITEAVSGRGGAWGAKNTIVFAPSTGDPLYVVGVNGENRRPVTRLPANATSHRLPSFLPDGVHFLFFQQGASGEELNILVGSTEGMQPRKLLHADAGAIWSDTGHVLFVRDGVLRARPFNPRSLELEGEAVTLAEGVVANTSFNTTNVSAARGTLTYVAGAAAARSRLIWYDRATSKEIEAVTDTPADYLDPRLSRDGRFLAYCGPASQPGRLNVFLHDLSRRVSSRFTFGTVNDWSPVWSPDGKWIAYTSFQGGDPGDIYVKAASGTGSERKVIAGGRRKVATDWTADGTIVYHEMNAGRSWDIHAYSLRDNRSRVLLSTPFAEYGARVAPNGRWLVYASSESGRLEVYLTGLGSQAGAGKWQVSSGGGRTPSWSPDGTEIYFSTDDNRLMVARVDEVNGTLQVGVAQPLLPARLRQFSGLTRAQYSTADGRRFLINEVKDDPNSPPVSVTVVQNWERGTERLR